VVLIIAGLGCAQVLGLDDLVDRTDHGSAPSRDSGAPETSLGTRPGDPVPDGSTDAGPPAFLSVAAGDAFACAVKANGSVWCWGANDVAQLGVEPSAVDLKCASGTAHCNDVPQKIALMDDALAVATGQDFACAVRADHSVWCWGGNDLGQLGHATGDANCTKAGVTVPCNATPQKVIFPAGVSIASVSTGWGIGCARTEGAGGGDVYCWGNNGHSTVGLSEDAGVVIPVPHKIGIFNGDVIDVSVALDTRHACAVRSDGTVWCWGDDYQGRIGTADVVNGVGDAPNCGGHCWAYPHQVSVQVPPPDAQARDTELGAPLTGARRTRVGDGASCALKTDGSVWCWGIDLVAALADDGPYTVATHSGARLVPGLPPVTVLERHSRTSFAVDGTGAVWGWGQNTFGDLGNGTITGRSCDIADAGVCAAPPTNVSQLAGAKAIATGRPFGLMIRDDAVWTWGENTRGELGHAPNTSNDRMCGASPTDQRTCNPTPQKVSFP
jgi:alpha-tubulin suppressor-like RCC1 family protein